MMDQDKATEQVSKELKDKCQKSIECEGFGTRVKHVKEKLKHENKNLDSSIQYTPLAMVKLDEGRNIVSCNPGFETLFQFEESEIVGRNLDEVIVGKRETKDAIAFTKKALKGAPIQGCGRRYRKDGTAIDVEVIGVPLIIDRQVVGTSEIYQDISERKRVEETLRLSEENYQAVFNAANDVIFISDIGDGQILDVNKKIEEMYGYTVEEIKRIGMKAVSAPETGYTHEDALRSIKKAAEGEPQVFECVAKDKDGQLFWVEVNLKRAFIGGKERLVGVVRDISERKKMEEEVIKAQKLESIGVLASGIAHDFNNLLTGISGYIDLAQDDLQPESGTYDRLCEAQEICMRAKDLTKRFLTFSNGGGPIKKIGSLKNLIEDSANLALTGSNVRCEFSIPGDLWQVEIDEAQIKQAITNLIINANEAMPTGGVIKLHAENLAIKVDKIEEGLSIKKGKYVQISIQDQGTGISEELIPRLFDPYFSTKERGTQKGMGLGLTTAYSIIKKHKGYIHLRSEVGAGTTVDVYIPALTKETRVKEEAKEGALVGQGRILLMDDEAMVRDVAGQMLNRIGYDVEFAEDGAGAIELYKKGIKSGRPFHAVILDLTVRGGMGGKDAIQKLSEIDRSVKGIVSSGYSDDPAMTDFEKYGFSGAVAKPYNTKQLRDTLYEVIKVKN